MFKKTTAGLYITLTLIQCSNPKADNIDALFSEYQNEAPGAAIMVIHKGEILLERYYGLADMSTKTKVAKTSNFRLASVSKQFTAMAILQLMDQGIISFSTGLRELFPEFPSYAEAINYGQLLHHTSGLLDYEDLIPDSATVPVRDAEVLELLLHQDSTYFPPGSNYSYSNSGYALLALTVERLSGLTFSEYLEEYLFRPLEMDESVAFVDGINTIPNRAFGYHVDNGNTQYSDQSMTSSVLGDGGIYSSVSDLYKWDQALFNFELVSEDLLDSAFTPWLENYGCGWRIEDYKGLKRISHTGSTIGFRTDYQRFPEMEFSIIILTNRREPGVQYLAEALTDIYLLKE
ncbi:MAG: beta-lactamase family protein [Candidatus Marinimicrobia bacterium]|jgi:CubicO group peptidase (beta-lactamase class C family)|nr:beta-lactamase family protein [Candidatus Neomarinimicrobiota bacterium]MBT3574903.1 beta-lactamase family protein [Candidatus Neomarinimicrobiota bacterium]MBT3679714.1 beta-lactamase family protein [Candidatus Neomarinimicrobiota bacterium]MBT3950817.1 beta-lactamase family protein [Candidatus Neomarinimicrobiota bacterium]MBT4252408.1 beta-lactamase family protein [Candidatus Neomarinimicrobiota bacterium]